MNETITFWLVQVPAVYGWPASVFAEALICGAVRSIRIGPKAVVALLPAASMADLVIGCVVPSFVTVTACGQIYLPKG